MNYKGMDENMRCRGFQYEVGREYETDRAEACRAGFHACENPLDVFGYYPPSDSRYFEVEQSGELDKQGDDSKVASTKIKIGAEIKLNGLIEAGVKFILDKADCKESNTGDQSAATNTGDYSAATNTGDRSAASVSGKDSVAIVTGKDSRVKGAIGCWIVVTERGDWNGDTSPIICVKAAKVDGKTIKADTYYKLVGGEFVECGTDE